MGVLDLLEEFLARRNRATTSEHHLTFRMETGSREDLPFLARIDLVWRLPQGRSPATEMTVSARCRLQEVAGESARHFSVLRREEAQSAVGLAFDRECPRLGLAAARVVLDVDDEVMEFAREQMTRELETRRGRAALEAEVARLTLLRDTMLRDAPTARLWWLGADPARLVQLADHADAFERVVGLVSGRAATGERETWETSIAGLLGAFLADLGPEHRDLLVRQLGRVFHGYERPDLAERLPVRSGSPNGVAPPDGTGPA
ncbi:hypothetical protein [Microtetraspora malaysiensis]|uniref:Uncharacterized protein n=1 Tax=Microtetraspora malaysiensis TaxID=161358 RepID=A0ABW6SL96_9ACTN